MVPKCVVMVGVAASGKSTIAKELAESYENAKIFSSDALRAELYGNENDQSHNNEVFNELHRRIKEHLRAGNNAIYDATNLNSKRRMAFLRELKNICCFKEVMIVLCPLGDAIIHNANRDRVIPIGVIEKHIKQFQIPMEFEGWDCIKFVDTSSKIFSNKLTELMNECDIPHDNPHHSLSIKGHMLACYKKAQENSADAILSLAARYHDIGKPFCKEFENRKGEPSEIAHYYNHHNVSAYFFLCSMSTSFIGVIERIESRGEELDRHLAKWSIGNDFWEVVSEIAFLINYHMEAFLRDEKGYKKFEELIGEERAKRLRLLHEYDLAAH